MKKTSNILISLLSIRMNLSIKPPTVKYLQYNYTVCVKKISIIYNMLIERSI